MSARASPGALLAWWEGDRLAFGVLAGEGKGRLRLVLEDGREDRIQPGRVAWVVEPSGIPPGATLEGRRAAGARVREAVSRVERRAAEVDVASLWEIASSSEEALEEATLAGLALGDGSGESRAALAVALLRDGVRFVRRSESWQARRREAVEEILEQRRRAAERRAERAAALAALAAAARSDGPFVPTGSGAERRYLDALEQLAVRDEDAPEAARAAAVEVLEACGLRYDRPREGAFRLLRKLGRFDSDDENLEVLRYGLRTAFPEEVEAAAREAARRGFDRGGRVDLTGLDVLTVDGPHTREIDDGLSIEPRPGGGYRLGVHIADPAAFSAPGDVLDREALSRSLSHYFPDRRLPMFPPAISEEAASLLPGEERPALSVLAEVSPSGRVESFEIVRSIVRSRARLDYDGVDRTLRSGDGPYARQLRDLAELSERVERWRLAAGAVVLRVPEVEVRVDRGEIRLERRDPASAAQRLVSEAMVLAGALVARCAIERGVPVIYRRQDPPDRPLPLPSPGEDEIVAARRLRRALRRGEVSLAPGPHHALGLPAYAQATSPLRRYQDLATHRQVGAVLAGKEPVYDAAALQRIAATTERAESDGRKAERASERYWMLRWYESRRGERVRAVVAEAAPRPVVVLEDTLLEEAVPALGDTEPGDRVQLEVVRVVPRADLLVLRPP